MLRPRPSQGEGWAQDEVARLDEEDDVEGVIWDLSEDGEDPDSIDAAVEAPAPPQRKPLIAIVGRPNVGKSRLFNRMTASQLAIVQDLPGVTRDRQYGEGEWYGRRYQVVDTGGFEPDSVDVLLSQMRDQARIAIEEADLILFMVDGRAGILPADREIANLLRHSSKPVLLVVNKIDGSGQEVMSSEFWALGFDDMFPVSAEHGRNIDELMDRVLEHVPLWEEEDADDGRIRVAVVGRPNAGKSTLINRILGEQRLLTSDVPGTTRDAIDLHVVRDGTSFVFIDTAGVRRKRGITEQVEKYSVVRSFRALDRADVVLFVVDAKEGLTTQDQRVLGMAHEKGRAIVLLLNKWDLVEPGAKVVDQYVKALRNDLKFCRHAPILTVSALTGKRLARIFPLLKQVYANYSTRVSTSRFNEFLRESMRRTPPPVRKGRRLKIYFGTQAAVRPPLFVLQCNDRELVHFSWERHLSNELRRQFGFEGSPVRFVFRVHESKASSIEDI